MIQAIPHHRSRIPGYIDRLATHAGILVTQGNKEVGANQAIDSMTWTHTIVSHPNQVLFVFVLGGSGSITLPTCTFNSVAMDAGINDVRGDNNTLASIFYMKNPPEGTFTVDVEGSGMWVGYCSIDYYNVDLVSGPAFQEDYGVGPTSHYLLYYPIDAGDLSIGAIAYWDNGADVVPDALQTPLFNDYIDGGWKERGDTKTGIGTISIGFSNINNQFIMGGVYLPHS